MKLLCNFILIQKGKKKILVILLYLLFFMGLLEVHYVSLIYFNLKCRTTCIYSCDFWQDFHMLVANPRKQKLFIQVKDSLGFTDWTIGTAEVKCCFLGQILAWLPNLFN